MSNMNAKIGKNVALAVLSQIPVVSAFSKFCEDFVLDDWQERIDLWKEEVVKRLAHLDAEMEQKIRETSNFASILASAQRGALEDMEEDKVTLYANAVINAIKNEDIDNTQKHIFLNILRKYSHAHIKILHFINNQEEVLKQHPDLINDDARYPFKTYKKSNEALILYPSIINNFCKLIELDLHFWDLIVKELYNDHLIRVNTFWNSAEYKNRSDFKSATYIGQEFLAFIAEQENGND